jgi:hypothetical protein
MSEQYEGRQFVGMDLHRRRSVLARMTEAGERLETVHIVNDVDRLAAVIARAGESPDVVLEATYGWYWATDALAGLGARVHLAHPLDRPRPLGQRQHRRQPGTRHQRLVIEDQRGPRPPIR